MIINQTNRTIEISGRVVKISSGDLGNANTAHTYIPWANEGFVMGTFTLDILATTVSVFGTNDDNSVVNASADWRDITQALFGITNETLSGEWMIDTPIPFARLRITRLTTNITNSFDLKVSKCS